ncbi:MAG TPA: 23S rRNA (adenine(1618)-N(6))-methyltransferase RlmF [Cytophagaceae bacterium]
MALEKNNLHPRNRHRQGYDFQELTRVSPALMPYVLVNQYGATSIDFSNADVVKLLNRALLKSFYKIEYWDIPAGYLCPPIPGRADYIHYMADVLRDSNLGVFPKGDKIKVLDIGVGANCVYPVVGEREYGWKFVGSDIDPVAVLAAQKIIHSNNLTDYVELRLQTNAANVYKGIIKESEVFDIAICNPPFHSSLAKASAGTSRKWKNLGREQKRTPLNFGGQRAELWCKGGELAFIYNMIRESAALSNSCFWYSTLVSKSAHLNAFYKLLEKLKAKEVKTIAMSQGQKISRILAWTFLDNVQRQAWAEARW